MAIDKRIKGMEVNYYPDARYQLQWYKVPVAAPYTEHIEVFYKNKHVADVFVGKSKLYGVVFGKCTMSGGTMYKLQMHIASLFVNPKN